MDKINITTHSHSEMIDFTKEVNALIPKGFKSGICHVFCQHTTAGLTINENADPDVRVDFESHFNKYVPENAPYYVHTIEGPDDMPAHIKASLLGISISVPIKEGNLNVGIWQGIYLCEHRNHGGSRKIIVTIYGERGY